MRAPMLLAGLLLLAGWPLLAQENPVTNGGFEQLDQQGVPLDWEFLGNAQVTGDAHSGQYAVVMDREGSPGECGLNRRWLPNDGKQGTMLSQLKGGLRFWYRADSSSGPGTLIVYVIPMSADPFENTGAQRAIYQVPEQHVGDGQWHEGVLKYDFTSDPKVKWVHISPRISGKQGRLLLDDVRWVESVGPIPRFKKVDIVETPGLEGDHCTIKATVENAGDELLGIGLASIELAEGLRAEGGPNRALQNLEPDQTADIAWKVRGRRGNRGSFGLLLTAGELSARERIPYEPVLEIADLTADPFIFTTGRPTTAILTLRNTGHAMVRNVRTELRPGVPLATDPAQRRRRLEFIRPGSEVQVRWSVTSDRQTPEAPLRAVADADNTPGVRASCTVVVGPELTEPETAPPGWGVLLMEGTATIYNDRVKISFPRAQFGYGIGHIQRMMAGGWQTVAIIPRMSRLVVETREGKPMEHLVYADEIRDIPSPAAMAPDMLDRRLELIAKLQDANGGNWVITQTVTISPNSDDINFQLHAACDRPAKVLALDGPMIYAGEGAPAGTRRLDAIFPGLEWLVEGEHSSSTLDIVAGHEDQVRYVPHPHMVTFPMMCARLSVPQAGDATVALSWDNLAPYVRDLNRPSAAFASPDRFNGRASTLMGVFAPSMPEYINRNQRTAHKPLELAAGEVVQLGATVTLLANRPGENCLIAVRDWIGKHGVPKPNPLPHGKTWADEINFSMAAYLTSLWDEETEKWWPSLGGPAMWHNAAWSSANLYDMRMCLDLCPPGPTRERVRERYDRVVELSGYAPQADDLGLQFAGAANMMTVLAGEVSGLIRSQLPDGSWRFHARVEKGGLFKGMDYAELGPDNAAEIGTCAHNAWTILRFARITGDKIAKDAGLKALAFMNQFEVPRAAQVWEVPVHTPDILASSDACEAYLEGYRITGDRDYLEKAVYWAWTGLPFVYLWDVEGFEFLRYASIPVFGASWNQWSWFGNPVQWNGLRYAYAILELAEYDQSTDWKRIAEGITVSAMYQQSTEGKDLALWPDSMHAITKNKSGWVFAPRLILKNVYRIMGFEPTPHTALARVAFDHIRISATGRVTDAQHTAGTVSFRVAFPTPQTGYALVCNVTRPGQVRVNGVTIPESSPGAETQPENSWRYSQAPAMLEIRLPGTGEHKVELINATFRAGSFTAPLATSLKFEFAETDDGWRPTNDLAPFKIVAGILEATMTGPDPYLVRSNCEVPASSVKQIRIRMALPPEAGPGAQLFWTTTEAPALDEPKSLKFETVPDGEFHEYAVPVGTHELWKGTITSIRLDPTGGNATGTARIDWIRGE